MTGRTRSRLRAPGLPPPTRTLGQRTGEEQAAGHMDARRPGQRGRAASLGWARVTPMNSRGWDPLLSPCSQDITGHVAADPSWARSSLCTADQRLGWELTASSPGPGWPPPHGAQLADAFPRATGLGAERAAPTGSADPDGDTALPGPHAPAWEGRGRGRKRGWGPLGVLRLFQHFPLVLAFCSVGNGSPTKGRGTEELRPWLRPCHVPSEAGLPGAAGRPSPRHGHVRRAARASPLLPALLRPHGAGFSCAV